MKRWGDSKLELLTQNLDCESYSFDMHFFSDCHNILLIHLMHILVKVVVNKLIVTHSAGRC